MKIQIKSRWNASVIFETEAETIKLAVEKAISSRADLSDANLSGANLSDANLSGANLSDADLSDANLSGANLSGANLSGANLSDADLSETKKDFLDRLTFAKQEAVGLYKSVLDGKIDGSAYNGECACFVGTVANVRGCAPEKLKELIGLEMNSDSPTELLFMAIKKGDTPKNNQVSAIVSEWIIEFLKTNEIAVPVQKVIWE